MIAAVAGLAPAALAGCAAAAAVVALHRRDPGIASRVPPADGAGGGVRPWGVVDAIGRAPLIRRIARVDASRIRLEAAHVAVDVDRYVGLKAAGAAGVVVLAMLGPAPVPLLAPVGAAGAMLIPDLALARAVRRRRARIESQLPQFLDLLAAGSTAGLSALLALRRAAESVRDPLAGELHLLLERVDLGARWREELRDMAERLRLGDLRRAVMAMTRTESLGAPLAESLRRRADEVREARRAAAAERARKAPVKMLFPLVFMILPAFLLLTVVPVLLSTLRSIR